MDQGIPQQSALDEAFKFLQSRPSYLVSSYAHTSLDTLALALKLEEVEKRGAARVLPNLIAENSDLRAKLREVDALRKLQAASDRQFAAARSEWQHERAAGMERERKLQGEADNANAEALELRAALERIVERYAVGQLARSIADKALAPFADQPREKPVADKPDIEERVAEIERRMEDIANPFFGQQKSAYWHTFLANDDGSCRAIHNDGQRAYNCPWPREDSIHKVPRP